LRLFGPSHLRRSQPQADHIDPERVLPHHSVTTQAFIATLMRWSNAAQGQGVLNLCRPQVCYMLLEALLERGLHGAWKFHVEFSEAAVCTPHASPHPADVFVYVDDNRIDIAEFLSECSRRANMRKRGRTHCPGSKASDAIVKLDLQTTLSVVALLGIFASVASNALELTSQFIWHIGGRVDAQLLAEVQPPSHQPLPLKPGVQTCDLLRIHGDDLTDHTTVQFLCRLLKAIQAHFSQATMVFASCDASDVAKENTMNYCLVDPTNVCAVLAPTVQISRKSKSFYLLLIRNKLCMFIYK